MSPKKCIYWSDAQKLCAATLRIAEDRISCYDEGKCDGSGTCVDCSSYDVGGMKFSTMDSAFTNQQIPLAFRLMFLRSLVRKCCHWNGSPVDFYFYPKVVTEEDKKEDLFGDYFEFEDGEGKIQSYKYVVYPDKSTRCRLLGAFPWWGAHTDENPSDYPCNGSNTFCPYYTGPEWKYCTNEGLGRAENITAAQLQELRFYSKDWHKMEDPYTEWENSFIDPYIYAWTGRYEFEYIDVETNTVQLFDKENNPPMLRKVYPLSLNTNEFVMRAHPAEPAEVGMSVQGGKPDYPSLIKNISDMVEPLRIVWPSSSRDDPFKFSVSVVGNEYVWVVVYVPAEGEIYAVNLTEYPQYGRTAHNFIDYMSKYYPQGIFKYDVASHEVGLVFIPMKLSLKDSHSRGKLNRIRVYLKRRSVVEPGLQATEAAPPVVFEDGMFVMRKQVEREEISMDTYLDLRMEGLNADFLDDRYVVREQAEPEYDYQDVHIRSVFYHGELVQTEGLDHAGIKTYEPIVTTFNDIEGKANYWDITNNTQLHSVLWNSISGGKKTIYAIEELIHENCLRPPGNLAPMDCRHAMVRLEDKCCGAALPWRVTGDCQGQKLGVYLRRGEYYDPSVYGVYEDPLQLEVVYKGGDGKYIPANYILVKIPDIYQTAPPIHDDDYVEVFYATTEYKQCPVAFQDHPKLKYPQEFEFDHFTAHMPTKIDWEGSNVSFRAPLIHVQDSDGDQYLSYRDVNTYRERIIDLLFGSERDSMNSFAAGGLYDSEVKSHVQVYEWVSKEFDSRYGNLIYKDTGAKVTLSSAMERLSMLGRDDGEYNFTYIFSDSEGRPAGIRNMYFMFQSAIVQTRDVEIYYRWKMAKQFWLIIDQSFCTAWAAQPMSPGHPNGVTVYVPKCGDHSHQRGATTLYSSHSYGDPGPMWYPYNRCLMPRYHQDQEQAVSCYAGVEGFSNAGDQFGKRFAYWERMRGPDVFEAVKLNPIIGLGCMWAWSEGNWQAIGHPRFEGYTKIRSSHPNAPYGKDRESLRISRHYTKQNLDFYKQTSGRENDPNIVELSKHFDDELRDRHGNIRYDQQGKLPIWVHINDSVSEVSLTEPFAQHPFSHYKLIKSGRHVVGEEFVTNERLKLSEVVDERDLSKNTSAASPARQYSLSMRRGGESVGDSVWVYKSPDITWGWLELPKDPDRHVTGSSGRMDGVQLTAPQTAAWKTSLESAVYMDEGNYLLTYTAPVFDEVTNEYTNPTLTLDGGPEVTIDWQTGEWIFSDPYKSELHELMGVVDAPFKLFGRGSEGNLFIADSSGVHWYMRGETPDGVVYGRTFRGLCLSDKADPTVLPYSLVDLFTKYPDKLSGIDPSISGNTLVPFLVNLGGYKYVEKLEVRYKFGNEAADEDNEGEEEDTLKWYDIPAVSISVDSSALIDDLNRWRDEQLDVLSRKYVGGIGLVEVELSKEDEEKRDKILQTYGSQIQSVGGLNIISDDYASSGEGQKPEDRLVVYNLNARTTNVVVNYGPTRTGRSSTIAGIKLWVRDPVDRVETIKVYDRKVNVSRGDKGKTDYRDLLYYYSKVFWDTGSSIIRGGNFTRIGRNVKDVIVEFEYFDPGETRFADYEDVAVVPSSIPGYEVDADGVPHYGDSIEAHSKGYTVLAGTHVRDTVGDFVSPDETSIHAGRVGEHKLFEGGQEALYDEARHLSGGDLQTVYEWFWHPDEVEFFRDVVGIPHFLDKFGGELYLNSVIMDLYRVWMDDCFGCSVNTSSPYADGLLHRIDNWQGLGHWIYSGDPMYNMTCRQVVLFKKAEHIGENHYGTDQYRNLKLNPVFPWETPHDWKYYYTRGIIQKRGTYTGGSIGGPGHGPLDLLGGFNTEAVGREAHEYHQTASTMAEQNLASFLITPDPIPDTEDGG